MEREGRYLLDYGKRYGKPYDVQDKAREHMQEWKRQQRVRKENVAMLETGIKGNGKTVVDEKNTAQTMGSGTLDVFATPAMIALIEETAWKSIADKLEEGQGTVGTRLEVSHLSATPLGMQVNCQTELIEIDGRKLVFQAEVYDEAGKIGEGVHERFIIREEKFLKKAEEKKLSEKDN